MLRAITKTFFGAVLLGLLVILSSYLPSPNFQHNAALMAQSGGPIMPAPLSAYGNQGFAQTGSNVATTVTLTANQMVGGFYLTNNAAAQTITMDTAANACLLFPFVGNSQSTNFAWDWYLKNITGAGTATLAIGTGWTLTGTGSAATNTVRHFKFVLNTCPIPGTTSPTAAATAFSLETTAF